jgi:hypothetical protein
MKRIQQMLGKPQAKPAKDSASHLEPSAHSTTGQQHQQQQQQHSRIGFDKSEPVETTTPPDLDAINRKVEGAYILCLFAMLL